MAALLALAAGCLGFLGLFLPIGLLLFIGEAVFGSIGWGILHGALLLLGLAAAAVMLALDVPGRRLAIELVVAVAAGVVIAVVLASPLGPRVGSAIGLAVALAGWPILGGVRLARAGVDVEALKAKFYPSATIDSAKETIEWVRERTPLGRRS